MTDARAADMGITGNAVLLLGYIGGALARDDSYAIESIDVAAGTQVIRHCRTGNLYSVTVPQIDGVE
ncbi:hypothetical protein U1737_04875 [Sphingomonas sp. LB3N6]|uniref:hypothetical protein n=1 Tax=Sphingomonas fucosidasi TaxID=3096164 RepID=UPI002FC5A19D